VPSACGSRATPDRPITHRTCDYTYLRRRVLVFLLKKSKLRTDIITELSREYMLADVLTVGSVRSLCLDSHIRNCRYDRPLLIRIKPGYAFSTPVGQCCITSV